MRKLFGRNTSEPVVAGDAHDRLGDCEGDDLRVSQHSPGIFWPPGQEIVSGAEHRYQQQVEVGEHRGPSLTGSAVTSSTADFDSLRYDSFDPTTTNQVVELLIEAAPSGRHDERAGYLRPLDARRESASPATASDALVISRV